MENCQVQTLNLETSKVLPSFNFLKEIEQKSGQQISRCYQCKKCSGGCPMNFAMDLHPSQVVRYVQLGLRDALLKSNTIWICAACKTCVARCPNGIDVAAINDCLKQMANPNMLAREEKSVKAFHQAFLDSVAKHGRVHELGMMIGYKLKTGTYTKDAPLGLEMFKKGLLKILPHGINNKKEVQEIFRLAKEKSK